MNLNKKILELYNNSDINMQLNKFVSRTVTTLNSDEIESVKLETIWKCVEKFDNNQGTQFSTYLCRAFVNNLRRESNKYKPSEKLPNHIQEKRFNYFEFIDSLSSLSESHKNIVIDKYVYGLNNKEIGEKYGFSGETAGKKLKTAINILKQRAYGV